MKRKAKYAPKIFFSYCSSETDTETVFIRFIKNVLLQQGCEVLDSADLQPKKSILETIIEVTARVDAVICLAFCRSHIPMQKSFNFFGTSPWIHIEATLAHVYKKPLLLIGDSQLIHQGVFDERSVDCKRIFLNFSMIDESLRSEIIQGIQSFIQKILADPTFFHPIKLEFPTIAK